MTEYQCLVCALSPGTDPYTGSADEVSDHIHDQHDPIGRFIVPVEPSE